MSDENLGPVSIEWVIDNDKVASDLARTEELYSATTTKIEANAKDAGSAVEKLIAKGGYSDSAKEVEAYANSFKYLGDTGKVAVSGIDALVNELKKDLDAGKISLEQYDAEIAVVRANEAQWAQAIAETSRQQAGLNTQLVAGATEAKIVGAEGTKSLDGFGKSAGGAAGTLGLAWRGLRLIAQILPGVGVAGILAFATGPIIEWVSALFKGKDALDKANQSLADLNNALKGSAFSKAFEDVSRLKNEINLAGQGFLNKKEVLDDYNKSLGKSLGYTNSLDEAERRLVENGNAYIQMTLYKAAADIALQEAAKKAYEAKQTQLKDEQDFANTAEKVVASSTASGGSAGSLYGVSTFNQGAYEKALKEDGKKRKDAQLKQLADDQKTQQDIASDFQKKAAEIAKKNHIDFLGTLTKPGVNNTDSQDNALRSALNAELSAQQKATDLLNKYSDKAMAPAESAIDEIKNSFISLTAQINQANAKYDAFVKKYGQSAVDKYNADPVNKNRQLVRIDPSSLIPAEAAAISNQEQENQNQAIIKDLDEKRQLYTEYEKFREKVGDDIANSEYADLVKSGASFRDYLDGLQDQLNQQTELTAAQRKKRQDVIDKANLQEQKQQANFNLSMLAETLSFEQQTQVIIDNALNKAYQLRLAHKDREADLIIEQSKDQLELQKDELAKTIEQYQNFYATIENLTKKQAELQVKLAKDNAKAQLDSRKIDQPTYDALIKLITDAENKIKSDTILNGLNAIGDALQNIGQAASGLDKGFSSALNTIGSVLKQVDALGKNINKLQDGLDNFSKNKEAAGGGFLGTVSAISQIIPVAGSVISGVVSIVGGVINAFKAAKESAKEAAQEMLNYQNSLITGEIAYNELLRERAATIKDINTLTVQQLEQQQQLLATQQQQAQADYNSLLATIQASGKQITGEHTEKYGGFLGIAQKTKVVQDLAGLGGVDYDQLEKLYTEGKLTDSTKQWFEQLQKVHDEMGDISDETQQVNDQIAQIFTGTTADSLEQAILDGLKAGKRGFADFADDFKGTIQDALTSEFESTYLKDKIAAFYNDFATLTESGGGLTTDELKQLQQEYTDFINGASDQYSQLFKVLGIDAPTSDTSGSSTSTLSGAIKGITESQANVLEGTMRGIQAYVAQLVDISGTNITTQQSQLAEIRAQTLYQKAIELNTRQTAQNTNVLPEMKALLGDISNNTKNTTGAILRAAGLT